MVLTLPARAANQPNRIASFPCWQKIMLQVIGPNTVYLADTADGLKIESDSGVVLNDGLQINQATGIWETWWLGDLFAAASEPNTQCLFIAPGAQSSQGPGPGKRAGGGGMI